MKQLVALVAVVFIYALGHLFRFSSLSAELNLRPIETNRLDKCEKVALGEKTPESSSMARDVDDLSFSQHSYFFVSGRFSGDNRFTGWVDEVRDSLVNSSVFPQESIFTYGVLPDFILSDTRFEQHRKFLTQADSVTNRGAGYWFWKPLLIQDTLKKMEDGDFLAYLDIDEALVHLQFASTVFRKMQERGANFAVAQLPYMHRVWTKRDIYNKYCPGLDVEADMFQDKEASRLLIRKSPATVQFIDNWVDAVSDYHLVSDEDSHAENIEEYRENRHDQSLMTALLECGTPRPTQETRIDLCEEMVDDNSIDWHGKLKQRFCHERHGYHTYVLEA